jgi:hypothetical protein
MGKRTKKNTKLRWKESLPPYEVGRDGFEYRDIKKDIDGWIDAQIFRPIPYDLVLLKPEGKVKPGWWTGVQWDGYRLTSDEKVFYWKQQQEKKDASQERKIKKSN